MNRAVGREELRPLGVIDTLSTGYELVNRRPWLLLFPIVLDLLFWLGPKLSIVRLAGYLPLSGVGLEEGGMVADLLANLNLAFLLALYVPTVLGKLPFDAPVLQGPGGHRLVWQVVPETFVIALAVLLPLSLLVAALYLGQIAQVVRQRAGDVGPARTAARNWWRLVVLHAAGLALFVAVALPAGLLTAAAGAWVSRDLGSFLLLLFQVSLLWAGFYFFFALSATLLESGSPIRAALRSVEVVRRNFWSAVGLIGLVLVIDTGLPLVYRMATGEWGLGIAGLIVSIVANAYIGTGLAAATMLYYHERVLT